MRDRIERLHTPAWNLWDDTAVTITDFLDERFVVR
jgi:hypothetical protein